MEVQQAEVVVRARRMDYVVLAVADAKYYDTLVLLPLAILIVIKQMSLLGSWVS